MDYKKKYIKYKQKYLKLKNMNGGENIIFNGTKKYIRNSNNTGIFHGKIIINGYNATDKLYEGKWHDVGTLERLKKLNVII